MRRKTEKWPEEVCPHTKGVVITAETTRVMNMVRCVELLHDFAGHYTVLLLLVGVVYNTSKIRLIWQELTLF